MKKLLILTIGFLLSATLVSSQSFQTDYLYQKYKGSDGIVALWLPGAAMKLAAKIADLDGPEADLLRNIRSLRVLTIEDNSLYPDVNFAQEINFKPEKNNMKMLLHIIDGNEEVLILGKEKNGCLRDIVIIVGGDDNVMVHMKGRIKTNMIADLANIAGIQDTKFL